MREIIIYKEDKEQIEDHRFSKTEFYFSSMCIALALISDYFFNWFGSLEYFFFGIVGILLVILWLCGCYCDCKDLNNCPHSTVDRFDHK